MSATRKGDDMDREVFVRGLEIAREYGELLTIGGGEPTIHPEFFEYLNKAMEYVGSRGIEGPILVITNGKIKRTAERLLRIAEDERDCPLNVELSLDDWHDPIHPEIVRRFQSYEKQRENGHWRYSGSYPKIGTRTVSQLVPVGRAADPARGLTINKLGIECCCQTPLVDPSGDIWSCGCKLHKLGTVWDENVLDGYNSDFAHQGGFDPDEEKEAA